MSTKQKREVNLQSTKSKRKRRESRVLSNQEIDTLLKAPDTLRDKILLYLLVNSGLRRSDIVKIKINDINFTEQRLKVEEQEKTEKPAIITLTDQMIQDLKIYVNREIDRTQGFLFPSPIRSRDHITERQVNNIIEKLIQNSGLNDITPHDFRATLLTRFGSKKISQKLVSQALGVSIKTVQKHYEKYTPEEIDKAFLEVQR